MIDWEDSFDLEALASQMKLDESDVPEGRRLRAVALLQRGGLMSFDMDDGSDADPLAEHPEDMRDEEPTHPPRPSTAAGGRSPEDGGI